MPNVPTGAATAAARTTSPEGRGAIARREGIMLTAYLDSVGIWTIGVGHTSAAGEPKVTKGMKISAWEADHILSRDLAAVEATVNKFVNVPVSQNEFDALVSLCFNIGGTAFRKSTLIRKLNAGDKKGAADQFLVWNKGTVNGKKVTIRGLVTRRQDERQQFLAASAPVQPVPAPIPAPEPAKPVAPPVAAPAPQMPSGSIAAPPPRNWLLAIIIDAVLAVAKFFSRKKGA